MRWLIRLLHRRSRRHALDFAHVKPNGDRRPLMSIDEVRREWGL